MKTKEELLSDMAQFTGTEEWHRYSPLFRNVLLTDGAKYLAEECGAFWLIDMIASHLPSVKDTFAVAVLTVKDGVGHFCLVPDVPCEVDEIYAEQKIEWTDFPLEQITFYVSYSDGVHWVILLPSEY
jgi:hypothetical protein